MKKFIAILIALVTVVSVASCGKKTGSVYFLNFKPETDAQMQALAKAYTEETGVNVKVVTAASGTYEQTLTTEMGKSLAPTLFQINGPVGYERWAEYCLDLTGSDIVKQVTNEGWLIKSGKGVYGVAYAYEAYGIIVNKGLLESKTSYKVADITSLEKLEEVCNYITQNKETLGFSAFTSSTLDGGSSWRFSGHLANVALSYEFVEKNITAQPATIEAKYTNNMKRVWDLYVNNATVDKTTLNTAANAEAEFKAEQAVFFQNGVWESAACSTKTDNTTPIELGYLPIFMGINDAQEGFCCGTENYWSVSSACSKADQEATLAFLNWMASSEKGTKALADMGFTAPFKNAKSANNTLSDLVQAYNGNKTIIPWTAMNLTPNTDAWRAPVVSALAQYSAGEADWSVVTKAMVEGWASNYKAQ